ILFLAFPAQRGIRSPGSRIRGPFGPHDDHEGGRKMLVQPKSWISGPDRSAAHRLRVSAAHAEWNHVGIALTAMEEGFFRDEGITDLEVISFWEETGALVDREKYQVDLLAEGTVDIGIDPRA